MPEVITFGEPLVLFAPKATGLLRHQTEFVKTVGGAELNTAIGVSRLGVSSGWCGQVGEDEFGYEIENVLRSEGVDTQHVKHDPNHPTGIMFKQYRGVGDPSVFYYRSESAACHVTRPLISDSYLQSAKCIHTTGITAAISQASYDVTLDVLQRAKTHGLQVSFDPNVRLRLMNRETLLDLMRPFLELSDVLLLGQEEGEMLFEVGQPEAISKAAHHCGVRTVVVKLGSKGSYLSRQEETFYHPALEVPRVVDTVGAGDGFNAGFLAGVCMGYTLKRSIELASLVGGYAVTVQSDYQGYPTRSEVNARLEGTDLVVR